MQKESPRFSAKVVDGKLEIRDRMMFGKYIRSLEGEELVIDIVKKGRKRTLRANTYLWGVVYASISEHTGFTPEELPPLKTLEDAKTALDAIRIGVLTRKITHAEANAGSKALSEWAKCEGIACTQRVVNELHAELQKKTAEIEALRIQLKGGKKMRVIQ